MRPWAESATTTVIEAFLNFFWCHWSELPDHLNCKLDKVAEYRKTHLGNLISYIDLVFSNQMALHGSDIRRKLSIGLECTASYSDLLHSQGNIRLLSSQLSGLSQGLQQITDVNISSGSKEYLGSPEYVQVRIARLQMLLKMSTGQLHPMMSGLIQVLKALTSTACKSELLFHVSKIAPSLEHDQLCALTQVLVSADHQECLDASALLLLQTLILSRNELPQNEASQGIFTNLATRLSLRLTQVQPSDVTILSLQTLDILVRHHGPLVNQHHIDAILSLIFVQSSLLQPMVHLPHAYSTYKCLCTLLTSVLILHRRRTGGRYHLLLPALQSLLHCLFTPFPTTSSPKSQETTLTKTSAQQYTRLIALLCDPAPSTLASQHHSQNQQLSDLTISAKRIAGENLHYLLMTYCELQLKGSMEGGVKQEVERGVWAVLEVLRPEVRAVVERSMGEEGRGIWRGVVGEWRRQRTRR